MRYSNPWLNSSKFPRGTLVKVTSPKTIIIGGFVISIGGYTGTVQGYDRNLDSFEVILAAKPNYRVWLKGSEIQKV